MSQILTIGNDISLLHTRGLVLEKTGSPVYCELPESALARLQTEFFEVIVLCHTISESEKAAIRRQTSYFWPLSKIVAVEVSAISSTADDESDICIPWQRGPQALIDAVIPLLRQSSGYDSDHKTVAVVSTKAAHTASFICCSKGL